MSTYVDTACQTEWAGIMQKHIVHDFSAPRDNTTPPDETLTEKQHFPDGLPVIVHSHHGDDDSVHPLSLLERRQGRPGLVTRISLPSTQLNDEVPLSPPPTEAILSPLPEANVRDAGHTPLIPRARSPIEDEEQGQASPIPDGIGEGNDQETLQEDPGLTGALVLPTDPSDPLQKHHFSLDALDQQLGKIERQQKILRGEFDDDDEVRQQPSPPSDPVQSQSEPSTESQTNSAISPRTQPTSYLPSVALSHVSLAQHLSPVQSPTAENKVPGVRRESAESRKSADEVDGVILKTPPSNFGAPLGQL